MENFLQSTDMIAKAGQIFLPIPGGKRWPAVATADIAAKAASWLLESGWSGHHRLGVHGPKDLSADEAAEIISAVLGAPVKCVEATIDQARGAMKGMGTPDFVVEFLIEQWGGEAGKRLADVVSDCYGSLENPDRQVSQHSAPDFIDRCIAYDEAAVRGWRPS
jgi:uncharacterized protein YbjT (DUF2867 family)